MAQQVPTFASQDGLGTWKARDSIKKLGVFFSNTALLFSSSFSSTYHLPVTV